jgi:hypothetical protein
MKPKKLNLHEIHRLYLLLRSCLPEKEEAYLIDEIEKMVGMMENGEVLLRSIEIMYPKVEIDTRNPLEILLLFTDGLKCNDFFEYVSLVREIKRGKRKS